MKKQVENVLNMSKLERNEVKLFLKETDVRSLIKEITESFGSVSYTHLDVYKRQAEYGFGKPFYDYFSEKYCGKSKHSDFKKRRQFEADQTLY